MSFFTNIPTAPPDPILGLNAAFNQDSHPDKLNLGVGAYRTEEGKPLILSSILKAEQKISSSGKYNKEYIPIDGFPGFNQSCAKMIFGEEITNTQSSRIITSQCLSGTGSLRIGMEFIKKFMPGATLYLSEPTWGNHKSICNAAGVPWKAYRYYNSKTNALDYEGLMEDLKNAPSKSVILLHACAHNPTGLDPTKEQWGKIAELIREKEHFPFFDSAYQGFASGDLNEDAYALRYFVKNGFEMLLAQSYAKNFGLYGERIGALHVVCANNSLVDAVRSQIKPIIRAMYSSPPIHGAFIVYEVLTSPELYSEWEKDLKVMAGRIREMRQLLFDALKANNTPGDWNHILTQIGMFSFTGLSPQQVETLIKKWHIYLTSDGRISMPGLNTKTVPYLAKAMHDVVTNKEV